ncbi:MAG TPA: enoyl-CoA hydratase-related protein [Steroidobacteraceae bacterium]|nr:enoyl-CoA hydratase-related protein [Steroidobacteraceae bacterium]
MSADTAVVSYELRTSVAHVTLNRPAALNAFNQALRVQLAEALQRAAADPVVRAVALLAAGRAFSAGGDLKEMQSTGRVDSEVRRQLEEEYAPGIYAIAGMSKPVITAVEGLVAGIGCAYVLASDLVVMAEDAYFTLPFQNIALVPDGGITWMLERQIGARRAFQLAVECERVPAARCLDLGLVNRVVTKGTANEVAAQWASQIAQRAPLAVMHTKRLLHQAATVDFAQGLHNEVVAQEQCIGSADFREGLTAFLEKRPARFSGG